MLPSNEAVASGLGCGKELETPHRAQVREGHNKEGGIGGKHGEGLGAQVHQFQKRTNQGFGGHKKKATERFSPSSARMSPRTRKTTCDESIEPLEKRIFNMVWDSKDRDKIEAAQADKTLGSQEECGSHCHGCGSSLPHFLASGRIQFLADKANQKVNGQTGSADMAEL